MSGAIQKHRVTILGQPYVFMSDELEHELLAATQFVDTTMKELLKQSSVSDFNKLVLLAAIKIALKYTQLEQSVANKADLQAKRLIDLMADVEV